MKIELKPGFEILVPSFEILTKQNKDGKTPLHLAIEKGNIR